MFYPAAHEPHTSIYSALCTVNANYTAHAVKQNTGFYRCFSCGLPNSTTSNTRPTKAAIIPPAPRRTLDRSTHPPYYNRVYKGAAVCSLLWIYTRRCNTLQTMPARRRFRYFPAPGGLQSGTGQQSGRTGSTRHPPPGGVVQRRAARNH